jgi:hypothetical protein
MAYRGVKNVRRGRREGGSASPLHLDPLAQARAIGGCIADALDPVKAPSKARALAEMSPEEQAEMRRLYERK